MQITVKYFAALREATQVTQEALTLPGSATIADAREAIAVQHPAAARVLPTCAAAVNQAYVASTALLSDGDELVFIPPLGGG